MKFEDLIPCDNNIPRTRSQSKRHTFVGTAEYVSPEVLSDVESGIGTDLWALGCIIYQMLAGSTPFKDKTEYLVFKRIMEKSIEFPNDFPEEAKDLVRSLLVKDPFNRLGSGTEGIRLIKKARSMTITP